ncbi:MAG TPA: holo-ACP synthase [bacterium]|nr:holo-ACP synthase [bacterium]
MLVGVGLDIIEVDRIQRSLKRFKSRFREKIFTPAEIEDCSRRKRPSLAYASRWAAKEALMKALGTGWTGGVQFLDIEVLPAESGAPTMTLSGAARAQWEALGSPRILLSLTDTRRTAAAVVLLEEQGSR